MKKMLISYILLMLCLNVTHASEVKLDAKVDRALITTGDLVIFTVTLDTPKNVSLEIPNVGDKIQGMRVVEFDSTPEKIIDERKITSTWYKLQADLVGSYILPAVELRYKNSQGNEETLKSSEIFVEVQSVLGKDKDGKTLQGKDIRDIKPIVRGPSRWYFWVLGVLGLCLLIAGIYYFWKRKVRVLNVEEVRPAHEIAIQSIKEIPRTPLKHFAFTLSEVMRLYFESTYFLPVTDRTIEEIRRQIVTVEKLSEDLRRSFMSILEQTELVKFTDVVITEGECERLISVALKFVEDTMPKLEMDKNDKTEEDSVI